MESRASDIAMEDVNSIKMHFDDEEWDKLTTLEKTRFINIKRNYDMMKSTGLNPKVPEFMLKRQKTHVKSCSDKLRKEEADPRSSEMMLMKIVKEIRMLNSDKRPDIPLSTKTRLMKELGKKMSEVDWGIYEMKLTRREKKEVSDLLKRAEKNLKLLKVYCSLGNGTKSVKDAESANQDPSRRYPKRKVPNVCYTEEEVPSDDDCLYCEDCGREYEGDCPVHGPLLLVPDQKVPPGHFPDRAVRTCPPFLSVCRSGIRGAGLGIWTEIPLPKGIVFGPYQGKIVKSRKQAEVTGYAWEVRRGGRVEHYVEGSDPSTSNWLRFVNCAQYEEHQNLVAFQFDGSIFYKTYKAVLPFTEFLVWYGDEYAVELGIDFNEDEPRGVATVSNKDPFCSTRGNFLRMVSDVEKNSGSQFSSFSADTLNRYHAVARTTGHRLADDSRSKTTVSGTTLYPRCEKRHMCINCGETFSDKWDLKFHRRTHVEKNRIGEVPYKHSEDSDCDQGGEKCLHCKYRTNRSHDLKRHMNSVHMGQKPYSCPHCEYRAAESGSLKKHVRALHMGQKPYKCPDCEYRASESGSLKTHVRALHMGQKPYKCPHCEYRAARSSHLRNHISEVHMGQKPYKCPHCEHRATQLGNLKRHVTSVHMGQKPYKCPHCEYRASESDRLKCHVTAIHMGQKPYKCPHCEHRATQLGNLKRHVTSVHMGQKPYKCPHCEYRAARSCGLKKHVRALHMGKKPSECD